MSGAEAIVSAFSEDHVERLTGLSKGRLRYWDRIGFFAPEHAGETRRGPYSRVYSFRDVVGLRTLELLRKDHKVSLQHLREVARKLSHMKDALWTRTTLYVLKRRVYVVLDKSRPPVDPTTGQYAIEAVALKAVMTSVSEAARKLRTRAASQHGRITRHRYIAHNAPVIAGTRITTQAIKNFRESGYSVAQIIREYPDLTAADVSAALAHKEASAPAVN